MRFLVTTFVTGIKQLEKIWWKCLTIISHLEEKETFPLLRSYLFQEKKFSKDILIEYQKIPPRSTRLLSSTHTLGHWVKY